METRLLMLSSPFKNGLSLHILWGLVGVMGESVVRNTRVRVNRKKSLIHMYNRKN